MKKFILLFALVGVFASCSKETEQIEPETAETKAATCLLCGTTMCGYDHNEIQVLPNSAELQSAYTRLKSIFRSVRGSMAFLENTTDRIYFLEEDDLDGPMQMVPSPYSPINFVIKYKPGFFNGSSYTTTSLICLLHELYHIYAIINHGAYFQDSVHEMMITQWGDYRKWVRYVFSDKTEDFYNKIIYTGTVDTLFWSYYYLSQAEQDAIMAFFAQHNIPVYERYPFY